MAILDEKKLKEEIKQKKFKSLYVISSVDTYKLHYFAELFKEYFTGATARVFYGDDLNEVELLDLARTQTLWNPQNLIFVKNADKISSKKWETLLPLLEEENSGTSSVVFFAAKVDGRIKFFQSLQKSKGNVALAKLEIAAGAEWQQWLQLFKKEVGKEIEESARLLLQEWTQGSLHDLHQTIHKAALYSGESDVITREHVVAVGFKVAPEDIFQFIASVMAGNKSQALTLVMRLLSQGEEPLAIIGLLLRQYRWLLAMLSLRAEGKPDSQIASECGIFPSAGKVLFPASRRVGGKGVIQSLEQLAQADVQLKSTRIAPKDILVQLVLSLA